MDRRGQAVKDYYPNKSEEKPPGKRLLLFDINYQSVAKVTYLLFDVGKSKLQQWGGMLPALRLSLCAQKPK